MSDLVWRPNAGSQQLLLSCPINEILLEGTRAGGKSDVLIVDYLAGVGKGWGKHYTGIIFRNEYKHLGDIIKKSQILIPQVFPDAKFKRSASELKWVFAGGEELLFRHAKTMNDYDAYHGHEYSWQGYEELTRFPNLEFYDIMESTCRSPVAGIRKRRISTTNPFGIGHNFVKQRFIDPAPANVIINDEHGVRVRIHSSFVENPFIYENDKAYIEYLKNIKDPNVRKAWLEGDWNIVGGGAFDDLFSVEHHVIDLEQAKIPKSWKITRSFDWGSSAPFSVGWWVTSPGDSIDWYGKTKFLPKGTKIRVGEWYGAMKGETNKGLRLTNQKIAQGIIDYEEARNWKVKAGGADSQIWADGHGEGKSIYDTFDKMGVKFDKAPKGPGSRKTRMSILRDRLDAVLCDDRERPGIYVGINCREFIRQIPMLPRDEKDYETVDSDSEDHLYDEATYELINYEKSGGMITV